MPKNLLLISLLFQSISPPLFAASEQELIVDFLVRYTEVDNASYRKSITDAFPSKKVKRLEDLAVALLLHEKTVGKKNLLQTSGKLRGNLKSYWKGIDYREIAPRFVLMDYLAGTEKAVAMIAGFVPENRQNDLVLNFLEHKRDGIPWSFSALYEGFFQRLEADPEADLDVLIPKYLEEQDFVITRRPEGTHRTRALLVGKDELEVFIAAVNSTQCLGSATELELLELFRSDNEEKQQAAAKEITKRETLEPTTMISLFEMLRDGKVSGESIRSAIIGMAIKNTHSTLDRLFKTFPKSGYECAISIYRQTSAPQSP